MYTSGKKTTDPIQKRDQVSDLIKLDSNVYMKKAAYDEAQTIHTDMKFVNTMAQGIWGVTTLANRCVWRRKGLNRPPLILYFLS